MKHESNHKLDVACLDCIKVHLEHKKKLIDLLKDIDKTLNYLEIETNSPIHKYIKELLKEIENEV